MFHRFMNQDERREYGGSDFVEIQFCRMPVGTSVKEIIAVDSIRNWLDDSLYVEDYEAFYKFYSPIFGCGIYNNLQSGPFDVCGINYYKPEQIDGILVRMLDDKPDDYKIMLLWLTQAKKYNGFYILGV